MKRSLLIPVSIAACAFFLSPMGCTDDSSTPSEENVPPGSVPSDPPVENPPVEAECSNTACSEDGSTLVKCVEGKIEKETCEFGCENDACNPPECTESICADEKTLNVCNDGHIVAQICDGKCENNTCIVEPECSETKCNDNKLEICTDGILTIQECEYGCEDAKCVVPECTETECKDSSTLLVCTDGKITEESCEYGCSSGQCWPNPIISLNDKRVLITGNSLTYYGETVIKNKREVGKGEGLFKDVAKYYGDNVIFSSFTYGSAGLSKGRDVDNAGSDCTPDKSICMKVWTKKNPKAGTYGMYDLMTTLYPHYYDFDGKKDENMDEFYHQDYVFIQERTDCDSNTEKYALKIQELFPPSTQMIIHLPYVVYDDSYATSSTGKGNKNKALLAANNLHKAGWLVVPWGKLVYTAYKGKEKEANATFGQNLKTNDFRITKDTKHHNYLSGYLEALAMYTTITGHSAIASDYNIVDKPADKKYIINDVINVSSLEAAIAIGYYNKDTNTKFKDILFSKETMSVLQKRLDEEVGIYDNRILYMEPMTDAGSFFPETLNMKNLANMTDGNIAYKQDDDGTYAALTWAASAEVAKDYQNAPHYDANGTQNESGKYLCGFTYKLPQKAVLNRMRFYNPGTTLEINGFDVLLSADNENWTVAYSGKDLVKGLEYILYSEDSKTNYIEAEFLPTEAQYIRFALTEPRYQPDSAMTDADIEKLISDYNEKYKQTVSEIDTSPQDFRIVELEVFRYTDHYKSLSK